jgi:uncharacterized protein YabN with tetrapyrrole methylase and pyrophosphatase domain
MRAPKGSLCAVGIGIRAPAQTTLEASARIQGADKVYTILADPLAECWIRQLNRNTESLGVLYAPNKPLRETYREMVERIVGAVQANLQVCAASYGHPGVFAYPLHEAVRRLRLDGFSTEMLAGVSAEDCLFAELGVDPAVAGRSSYEATDFLIRRRPADPSSALILWQIGAIAQTCPKTDRSAWNPAGIAVLTETLLETYRRDHEVIVYESARFPICDSIIAHMALENLPAAEVTALSTLYVPPMTNLQVDEAMMRRLGIPSTA